MKYNSEEKKIKAILDKYRSPQTDRSGVEGLVLTLQASVKAGRIGLPFATRIRQQISYISPITWILQFAVSVVIVILIMMRSDGVDLYPQFAGLSVAMAIITLIGYPELQKSFSYNMWELEESCHYNLRQVTIMRMIIISGADVLILSILASLGSVILKTKFIYTAVYMIVPFSIISIASYFVCTMLRNRRQTQYWLTGANTALVFLSVAILQRSSLYSPKNFPIWLIVSVTSALILAALVILYVKSMKVRDMTLCN